MSNVRYAAVAVALLLSSNWASASTGSECEGVSRSRCSEPGKRILEVPFGANDGKNNVFTLASSPRDVTDVRLFSNGSEMMKGTTFTVNGREIRIADGFVPATGSLLQVSYITETPSSATRGVDDTQDHLHTLTRAILLRSINAPSIDSPQAKVEAPVPAIQRRIAVVPRSSTHKLGESLTLLARRIDERQVEAHRVKMKKGESTSLSGFEGIGDTALPSPFASILDPTAPSSAERSLFGARNVDASSLKRLKSISMLEQRLDSQSVNDDSTQRK